MPRRRWWLDEVAQQQVDLDGVPDVGKVAEPVEDREVAAGQLGEPGPGLPRTHVVVTAVDHQHPAVDAGEEFADAVLVVLARQESTLSARAVEVRGGRLVVIALAEQQVFAVFDRVIASTITPPEGIGVTIREGLS